MTDLSPEAQTIVDAFNAGFDRPLAVHLKPRIAVALRALAKQSTFADTRVGVTEKVVLVDDILKIATELEQI
jgi:hypothetical protein